MSILSKFLNDPDARSEDIGHPMTRTVVLGTAAGVLLIAASNVATVEATSEDQIEPGSVEFQIPDWKQNLLDRSQNPVSDTEMMERYASLADIKDALSVYSPGNSSMTGDSELRQRVADGSATIDMGTAFFMQNVTNQLVGHDQPLTPIQFESLTSYFQSTINHPSVKSCINDMGTTTPTNPLAHQCLMSVDGEGSQVGTPKSEFYKSLRAKIDRDGLSPG